MASIGYVAVGMLAGRLHGARNGKDLLKTMSAYAGLSLLLSHGAMRLIARDDPDHLWRQHAQRDSQLLDHQLATLCLGGGHHAIGQDFFL